MQIYVFFTTYQNHQYSNFKASDELPSIYCNFADRIYFIKHGLH